MSEYINRKILVDLVLSKLRFMGDARIMNQNDEKVLSEIDGYEKAINAVHELILDKDLIADVQPAKCGKWITWDDSGFTKCSCCNSEYYIADLQTVGDSEGFVNFCPNCGARMDLGDEKNE